MSSIYSTNSWATSTSYNVDDIVKNVDFYHYCLEPHTSPGAGSFDTLYNFTNNFANLWGGLALDTNGETKPEFIWVPSYNLTVNNNPRVKSIKFGDGYEQRLKDGINNSLLELDLSFENRSLSMTTAILHFLYTRQGTESFLFTPLSPYATQKRFVCRSWTDTFVFYDNYTIRAKFEEVAN